MNTSRNRPTDAVQAASPTTANLGSRMGTHSAKNALLIFALAATGIGFASQQLRAQEDDSFAGHTAHRISPHVYVIPGFPNIGVVIGNRATMVIDTGVGPRNAQLILAEVKKLSNNQNIYLATTHSHVEHNSGWQAFPPNTIWIEPKAQEEDVTGGMARIEEWRARSPHLKELLEGVTLRTPDVLYGREYKLDLGGLTVRLFYFGPAHSLGDQYIYVEEEKVLFPGDIVQAHSFPLTPRKGADPINWLAILDKLDALHPSIICPDHDGMHYVGDSSMIAERRAYLQELISRTKELKAQGVPVSEAGKQLTAIFAAKHPDWTGASGIVDEVARIYEVSP